MRFFVLPQTADRPARVPESESLVDRAQTMSLDEDATFLMGLAKKVVCFPVCAQDVNGKQHMVHMRVGAKVHFHRLDGGAVECALNDAGDIEVRQLAGAEMMEGDSGFGMDVRAPQPRKRVVWNADVAPEVIALMEKRFSPEQQSYIAMAYGLGLGGKAPMAPPQIAQAMGLTGAAMKALAHDVDSAISDPAVRKECMAHDFSFVEYRDQKLGLATTLEVDPSPSVAILDDAAYDAQMRVRLASSPYAMDFDSPQTMIKKKKK